MNVRSYSLLSLLALLLGCSSSGGSGGTGGSTGSGGTTGTGGTSSGTGGTGGAASALYGTLKLQLITGDDAYSNVTGSIYGSPVPATPSNVSETMNGCQLLLPASVTCSPACSTGTVCTAQNQCTAVPSAQSVGQIQIQGLKTSGGATSITINPGASNIYTSDTLPAIPCADGDAVTVQTSQFTIAGKCIAPLIVTSTIPIAIVNAQKQPIATTITWTPPKQAAGSQITMSLEISHHGNGQKGEIDCTVPDTGSFTIPQKLIADLIALGTAGYPSITLSRVASATATADPGVQFQATSTTGKLAVDTGVVSCGGTNSDGGQDSCPSGQTCTPESEAGGLTCKAQ